MPIIALLLILGGAGAVAVLYPQFRILAGAVIALFLGLVVVYFLTGDSAVVEQRRLDAEAVLLSDVTIAEERGFFRLSGRVTNRAEAARLRSFRIDLRLFDCPGEEAPLEECATIAEDDGIARVDVPPGQTRSFESVHRFSDRPEPLGVLRYEFTVTAAEAQR